MRWLVFLFFSIPNANAGSIGGTSINANTLETSNFSNTAGYQLDSTGANPNACVTYVKHFVLREAFPRHHGSPHQPDAL